MQKLLKIKFIPTENIFTLPEEEIIRIMLEDRGNYELIDKPTKKINEALKEEVVEETSTYNQVVQEEDKSTDDKATDDKNEDTPIIAGDGGVFDINGNEADNQAIKYTKEELEAKKVVELKEILNQNKILFGRNDNKDALIEKILTNL